MSPEDTINFLIDTLSEQIDEKLSYENTAAVKGHQISALNFIINERNRRILALEAEIKNNNNQLLLLPRHQA